MNCPYCGQPAIFLSSKEFYGKDYGSNIYLCRDCNAYVGTHGNTTKPLGTMANERLRGLRKRAHNLFDPLWRSRHMSRSRAYKFMQEWMNLPAGKAHIGMFDERQCQQLIQAVKDYRNL